MPILNRFVEFNSILPSHLRSTASGPGILKYWFQPFIGVFQMPSTIYQTRKSFQRNKELKDLPKTAVLSSYDFLAKVFSYTWREVLGINNWCYEQGTPASWVSNAKISDLEAALLDDNVQSLVTLGHGSRSRLELKDGIVTTEEVNEIYGDKPRKQRVWLQCSCGDSTDELPLGWNVMESPEKNCFFYVRKVNAFDLIFLPQQNYLTFVGETQKCNLLQK